MSRRKVTDHARREQAARRDCRRVRPARAGSAEPAAAGASPSQEVALGELLAEFRKRLTEEERLLADLRARGLDWGRIAAEVGGSPEGLRKQLARAVSRVAGALGLEGFDA